MSQPYHIPKIIHFVWVGSSIPEWVDIIIQRWKELHPGWVIMIHDETSLLNSFKELAKKCTRPCQLSDLIRLSVLYRHGGWYVDTDFWPMRSIEDSEFFLGLNPLKLNVSKQWGHKSGDRLPYANAPLASIQCSGAVKRLIDDALEVNVSGRCDLGPTLIKKAIEKRPSDFHIIDSAWFFPLSIEDVANGAASMLFQGKSENIQMRTSRSAFAMPYAAHLWASAFNPDQWLTDFIDNRKIAIVQSLPEKPMDGIARALNKIGFKVQRCHNGVDVQGSIGFREVALVVCWNGLRDTSFSELASLLNCPIFYVEHGFSNRSEMFQFDHMGFLHNSSWAKDNAKNINPLSTKVKARKNGDILFLGQVTGDTQLANSELSGASQALQIIKRNIPHGVDRLFRPHPQSVRHVQLNPHLYRGWKIDSLSTAETDNYRKTKQGTGLAASFEKCRFAIAINSNALVEATLAGIPCLAFGPSVGNFQGVYHNATIATLAKDIQEMMDGWEPDHVSVENFIALLGENEYPESYLSDPSRLLELLRKSGVDIQGVRS